MANIQRQLAALLGKSIVTEIRKTNEEPPRVSVIDVAAAITGKDANKASQDIGVIKERHPEVAQNLGYFKFAGRGQKNTPVGNARGIVEIVMLLPGHHAASVRNARRCSRGPSHPSRRCTRATAPSCGWG